MRDGARWKAGLRTFQAEGTPAQRRRGGSQCGGAWQAEGRRERSRPRAEER